MQDIYGPERDWGDICDEAYDKRKQAHIERNAARQPGRIVAEFDCGTHAVEYAKKYGFTVTAGINHIFAVREWV